MVGKAGLKAGVIGLVIMMVMTLLNQFVLIGMSRVFTLVSCGIDLFIYACIGVLAGFFLTPPRTPNQGAGAGAIAGLLGGVVSSVIGIVIFAVRLSSGQPLPGIDPQQMQQLAETGVNPAIFAVSGSVGALCGLGVGVGLAAAGGAVLAAVKSD